MSSGSLSVKDQKELERLLKPRKIGVKVNSVTKAEPNVIVDEFFEEWHKETEQLKAKITELETTNRNIMKRVFELETKIENLREANNVRQTTN